MKYNYAVVGIMPKQKSWFPASSMAALLEHLDPILKQFKNIVGYGGSMGGYAAIKYAKALKNESSGRHGSTIFNRSFRS